MNSQNPTKLNLRQSFSRGLFDLCPINVIFNNLIYIYYVLLWYFQVQETVWSLISSWKSFICRPERDRLTPKENTK